MPDAEQTDAITVSVPDEAAPRMARYMGRYEVLTSEETVDASNVVAVIQHAKMAFGTNREQARYLWNYYRGNQPIIWEKVKDVRPEIDNRIVENHAKEIVDFKVGYQLAEPLQYVLRHHDGSKGPLAGESDETDEARDAHLANINELNTLMFADNKESDDRELFEWLCICGIGFRICEASEEGGDAPFEQHTLSPLETFVVRESSYGRRPVLGVWVGKLADGTEVYNAWTDKRLYTVVGDKVTSDTPHTYGRVPIVEYQLNKARMGAFEPALPLLDAMNAITSGRLDGMEQTVQSLMKFINCDIDEKTFSDMLKLGAVKVTSQEGTKGDVDFIKNDLDQSQTQVTKDDVYQAVVNICGMPNRNGTSGSSSDTGAAVLLRDGWSLAESHAKGYELEFKKAEREFLRVVLSICEQSSEASVDLLIRDIELDFNRRNYEILLVRMQALTGMLPDGFEIHPEVAFRHSGLFSDPESAYLESRRWTEERAEEREQKALDLAARQGAQEGPTDPGPQAGFPQRGDDGAPAPSA